MDIYNLQLTPLYYIRLISSDCLYIRHVIYKVYELLQYALNKNRVFTNHVPY